MKKILFIVLSLILCGGHFSFASSASRGGEVIDIPASADSVCFNIENRVVHSYLENAALSYNEGIGRDGVSILDYDILGKEKAPYIFEVIEHDYDLPNWAERTGTASVKTTSGATVKISSDYLFAADKTITITATGSTTRIYNLVPQTVYWYKVLNSAGRVLRQGVFKTTGQLRMIRTAKVNNVRDIGGWPCAGGGHLAYGKIFRGGKLDDFDEDIGTTVDEEDINLFTNELGISSDLDLRNHGLTVSPLGCEIKNITMSAYLYLLTNKDSYGRTQSYYSETSKTLKYLADNLEAGKNTYVHCSQGADRTGMVIAIIEAICGVSEMDIVKDWELTSFSSICYFKYISQEENSYYYYDNGVRTKTYAEMRSTFKYLYDNYGGAQGATIRQQFEGWLKDKVFASEADKGESIMERIRQQLIVDGPSPVVVKDLTKETGIECYSVSCQETEAFNSFGCSFVKSETGEEDSSDLFSVTDFIDCSSYSKIIVNVVSHNIASFYDKNHNFIGGITGIVSGNTVAEQYGDDSVITKSQSYEVPAGAAYVRINMARNSGFAAVLSE